MNFKMSANIFVIFIYLCIYITRCAKSNPVVPNSPGGSILKCYGIYGCFPIDYPWVSARRPVSWFPEPPEKVNPKYCLYTRRNIDTCDPLNVEHPELFTSFYVPNARVYFIAHGFVDTGERPWIKKMTKELLERSDANVIVVDWSGGSDPPYTQAVANIRLVGAMTAHLIKGILNQDVGLQTERIHFIGHSLGAHLAAYVGSTLKESGLTLGRITGLDPAEPHFSKTDVRVRLDPSDAIFVDNIHTDANPFMTGGLGMFDPAGHVDFYPNGGRDQPGCNEAFMKYVNFEDGSFFKGMQKKIGCNHVRSYQYFTETINSPDKFLAVECPSWEEYLEGSCFHCNYSTIDKNGTQCARLGFHSVLAFSNRFHLNKYKKSAADFFLTESPQRRFVKMYLITGSSQPFYRSQYKVIWKISNSSNEIGKFRVQILGSEGETDYMDLGESTKYFDPNSEHKIVVAGKSVGSMKYAMLEWVYQTNLLNPFTWRVTKPPISVRFVDVESLETGERLKLCLEDDSPLIPGIPRKLMRCTM
ncbi:UNVERIFIED_CONTAM: hypothetical protein PYX00_004877 [Menopon gallinae]|uniref:Lipase domain-containing protein n=1 Tax=Menopon gallinae TaxID=328185 RepID=A0AAW2I689_9NEOP